MAPSLVWLVATVGTTGCDGSGDVSVDLGDGGPVVDGTRCSDDEGCDDGFYCNGIERCVDRRCRSAPTGPCDDGIDCTEDSCLEELDRCFSEPRDRMCSDGDACNGAERCVLGMGCVGGDPLVCEDPDPCTVDDCDAATGCVFRLRDLDFDGFAPPECGGTDCNDDPRNGAHINPAADEDCDDGVDSDCDGLPDYADDDCPTGNDACGDRAPLPEPGTRARYNTFGLEDDAALSCSEDNRVDSVFGLSLIEPSDVTVAVEALSGRRDGVVAIEARPADACTDDDAPPRACVRAPADAGPLALFTRSLDAGEHTFVLETPPTYAVDVTIDPATPFPLVDGCGAETAALPTDEIEGFFSDVGDDYGFSCGVPALAPGPDAAYRVSLDEPSTVTVRATASGETVRVAMTPTCDDAAAVFACDDAREATFRRAELPPGEYFVLVEPGAPGDPTYTIEGTVARAPAFPAGDACSTATTLTLDGPPGVVDVGDDFQRNVGTTCRDMDGDADAVFAFTLAAETDVRLDVDAGGPHAIAIRRGDCRFARPADEVVCSDSPAASQGFEPTAPLPAGSYQAVVTLAAPPGPGPTRVTVGLGTR